MIGPMVVPALGFNGAELLGLTIGGCFCNDLRYVAHAMGLCSALTCHAQTIQRVRSPAIYG